MFHFSNATAGTTVGNEEMVPSMAGAFVCVHRTGQSNNQRSEREDREDGSVEWNESKNHTTKGERRVLECE